MGFFPDATAAALKGRRVNAGYLLHFAFATVHGRYWLGFGNIQAGGYFWRGTGDVISVSGLESAIGGTAPETTFTLSGVPKEMVRTALDSSKEVTGRPVTVYTQFFDDDWQTLDEPYALYAGVMDLMKVTGDAGDRTVSVTAETVFTRRASPPWAWLTDRDQRRLYPGDRGLEFVPTMASQNPIWPNFEDEVEA